MKQRNFKGREVELFFNEYIQVENLVQKTIITPGTGITFDYKLRPTSLLLKFNEPFKDSTTYTISFTDAIRDATERNPATNLKLVFSTGSQLDSLRIQGRITDILSGKNVDNALVGLYAPQDTLNATSVKPVYYSKTDTSGLFSIENVRSGAYDLIAFTDANSNFVFNPQTERIGFSPTRINLNQNVEDVQVGLFSQNNTPVKIARTESRSDNYTLNLDKGLETYTVRFKYPDDSIPSILASPTQIKFFRTRETADTLPIQVTTIDSLGLRTELKHTINFRQKNRREKPEAFTYTPKPQATDAVEPTFTWQLTFNKPVGEVKSSAVRIISDSLKTEPFDPTAISWENNRSVLKLPLRTSAKREVAIRLERDAFLSVQGDTISPLQLTYAILDPENFGLIRGEVTTAEPAYFLELLDEQGDVAGRLDQVRSFTFRNIKPGRYRLRLVIDRNKNGRWDTGNYALRQPAEPIVYYPDLINVKQNFELEGFTLQF